MDVLLVLAIAVLFVAVAAFIAAPLLRDRDGAGEPTSAELADLEARKQAKYRQIRDAEMDFRSGKLSEDDFERVDGELRAEAIEILRAIDGVTGTAE